VLELSILHDRLTSTYRRLVLIAGNENVSAKDRIDAEAASCEVALAITKLAFEGPIVLKDFEILSIDVIKGTLTRACAIT
jgi:hypothetical protein